MERDNRGDAVPAQYAFANLCVYFALFAVTVLFYGTGRKARAKELKGMETRIGSAKNAFVSRLRIIAGYSAACKRADSRPKA
jgi:hypothetical protein